MDPEQTAYRSSEIWVHTVCHRGFLNILADEFVAIGALRVKISICTDVLQMVFI